MKAYYEPGPYKCRITEQGFNKASTGTPQFWLRFQVLERIEPFNDSLEKYSRTEYFAITERTADRVMQDLHTLGFRGDSFNDVDPRREGFHSFLDSQVELVCSHEDGQDGTPRERWRVSRTGRPLEEEIVRQLNRLLTKKPQSANGPIVKEIDGTQFADDDVPF
jgi:hypothetical protein